VSAGDLPMGIEQALTIAALDHRFRERLYADPVRAASEKGIQLDALEAQLLASTDKKTLVEMARRTVKSPQKRVSRRRFMKNVAASVALLVGGKAFLLCSGCTGADSWEPDDAGPNNEEPIQKWAEFAGYTCYVYISRNAQVNGLSRSPLLVALSDEGETCLSSVQRWTGAADHYGFSILAVNWTAEPMNQTQKNQLADDLSAIVDDYGSTYAFDHDACHLCSRGASTPMVFRAGFTQNPGKWGAAVLLGGLPGVSCADYGQGQPPPFELVSPAPALYYVIGTQDPEYDDALVCVDMLSFYEVQNQVEQVTGQSDTAVLHFSTIWEWIDQHAG
jgi:hypothetical protein